jgi:hypothetical protein
MKQHVYVLVYDHRHGQDISTYATPQAARAARAEIVMTNLEEVFETDARSAITDAYEEDKLDLCYDLYKAAVDDESLTIETCELQSVETLRPFFVADASSGLTHRVRAWPFAETQGILFCGGAFLWQCPRTSELMGFMYIPREPQVVTCLQCIAAENTDEQAPT